MDTRNIIHGLMSNHWREENEALVSYIAKKNAQINKLADTVCEQNVLIARLQSDILFYQRLIATYRENERVLINRHGDPVIFRRNAEGVFVEATNVLEEEELQTEDEDPAETARRLGFDSDSDYQSDDLMDMLMGE